MKPRHSLFFSILKQFSTKYLPLPNRKPSLSWRRKKNIFFFIVYWMHWTQCAPSGHCWTPTAVFYITLYKYKSIATAANGFDSVSVSARDEGYGARCFGAPVPDAQTYRLLVFKRRVFLIEIATKKGLIYRFSKNEANGTNGRRGKDAKNNNSGSNSKKK